MFFRRMLRAVQFEPQLFLEVANEKRLLGQAMVVVVLSSIASGIGSVGGRTEEIPMAIVYAFGGWMVWSFSVYLIGARLLPARETDTTLRAVLCATGFASAPGLLRLLAFFPPFTAIVLFGATLWMLGTTLVAAQQVLRYRSLPRTIGVSLLGWLIYQWTLF